MRIKRRLHKIIDTTNFHLIHICYIIIISIYIHYNLEIGNYFTIFSFTTLIGLIVKGLLKAVIPALLASYIFNYYCNRTYPTISVTFQDTFKQFMYAVGVFAVLTLVQNIIFVPFMMSLYTNTLSSGLVRAVIFILNMCTYGWAAFTLLKLCITEYNMSVRDTATTLVVSIVPLIVINYIIKNIF